jgi:hypothetical protein
MLEYVNNGADDSPVPVQYETVQCDRISRVSSPRSLRAVWNAIIRHVRAGAIRRLGRP